MSLSGSNSQTSTTASDDLLNRKLIRLREVNNVRCKFQSQLVASTTSVNPLGDIRHYQPVQIGRWHYHLPQKRKGLSPTSKYIEVSDWCKQLNYTRNIPIGAVYDFLFDAYNLIVGILHHDLSQFPQASFPHHGIRHALDYPPEAIFCGGRLSRLRYGSGDQYIFASNEFSGSYGTNWTDERRSCFIRWMEALQLPVVHLSWEQGGNTLTRDNYGFMRNWDLDSLRTQQEQWMAQQDLNEAKQPYSVYFRAHVTSIEDVLTCNTVDDLIRYRREWGFVLRHYPRALQTDTMVEIGELVKVIFGFRWMPGSYEAWAFPEMLLIEAIAHSILQSDPDNIQVREMKDTMGTDITRLLGEPVPTPPATPVRVLNPNFLSEFAEWRDQLFIDSKVKLVDFQKWLNQPENMVIVAHCSQHVNTESACDNCHKTNLPLRRCAKCARVAYCSVECQRADWRAGHKHICRKYSGSGGDTSQVNASTKANRAAQEQTGGYEHSHGGKLCHGHGQEEEEPEDDHGHAHGPEDHEHKIPTQVAPVSQGHGHRNEPACPSS